MISRSTRAAIRVTHGGLSLVEQRLVLCDCGTDAFDFATPLCIIISSALKAWVNAHYLFPEISAERGTVCCDVQQLLLLYLRHRGQCMCYVTILLRNCMQWYV